jgi:hypothetical protein
MLMVFTDTRPLMLSPAAALAQAWLVELAAAAAGRVLVVGRGCLRVASVEVLLVSLGASRCCHISLTLE